jgi:hypothetical protein
MRHPSFFSGLRLIQQKKGRKEGNMNLPFFPSSVEKQSPGAQ